MAFVLRNLTLVRGDRWAEPFDLPATLAAGATIEFAVAGDEGQDPFIQETTLTGGVTVADGVATFHLASGDSTLISAGLYVYSLRCIDTDVEETCYRGRFRVRETIGTGTGPPAPPPDYAPSLDFQDERNSQYAGQLV